MKRLLLFGAMLALSSAAFAQIRAFSLSNGTDQPFAEVVIRDFDGGPWRPLLGSLPNGSSQKVQFTDDDCAFDIRATLTGGQQVTWSGVNLCEARVVTLNRRPDGTVWVDYD